MTVSFNVNGGSGAQGPIMTLPGSSIVVPEASGITDSGYTFEGWNTSANGTGEALEPGATLTPTSSQTLYAQWSPDVFSVTFVPDGGSLLSTSANFTYGSSPLTLPSPSRQGFIFTGWFSAASGGSLVGVGGS